MTTQWFLALGCFGCATAITAACNGPGNSVYFPTFPPGPVVGVDGGATGNAATEAFRVVGDVLAARCGTLDCHGTAVRNFRVYGTSGLRLPPGVSGIGGTTDAEYQKTYESLVLIQPEVLSRIWREHGAHPERWIIITKGRGSEHHKGGSRMNAGDPADRCVTSWLTGATDLAACAEGSNTEPPGGPGF